ncbi:hypothetical protein Tco_0214333 [Tanacetum coccineum]
MASLTLEESHGEEDSSAEFGLVRPTREHLTFPGYFERGGPHTVNPWGRKIILHEAIAASKAKASSKKCKDVSLNMFDLEHAEVADASQSSSSALKTEVLVTEPAVVINAISLSFVALKAGTIVSTQDLGFELSLPSWWLLPTVDCAMLRVDEPAENGVSPLLDLIILRCAHKTCGTSSSQSLLPLSKRALIPSPKLQFALLTKGLGMFHICEPPLDVKLLTQYLKGFSANCFPLSDTIFPGRPNLQTMFYNKELYFTLSFREWARDVDTPLVEGQWGSDQTLAFLASTGKVPPMSVLAFYRYWIILSSLAIYDPLIWFSTKRESNFADKFLTPICSAIRRPTIKASYSTSLLDMSNSKHRA